MINDIINSSEYQQLIAKQIKETITHLTSRGEEFAVTANIKGITFNPELPEPIFNQLSNFSLFVLANYTYTTLEITEDSILFEAGFGKENFASLVTIPYNAVFQIIIGESILSINSTATIDDIFVSKNQVQKSFNAFKSNPHNKKLITDK